MGTHASEQSGGTAVNHLLEALLCTGVVFGILLIAWLAHVARREGHFWRLFW
jgi:hypothetical protein